MKTRGILLAAVAAFGMSAGAHAAIIADIVWVIDTSGSMGGDIAEVKQRITEFDTAMTSNGIDANYGLVRFGGSNTLIQDITDFSTFTAAAGPFDSLVANGGGFEDGSAAAQVALTASFRPNSVRNIIIVTDEDDDGIANRPDLVSDLAATTAINELINVIAQPNDAYYGSLAASNGGQLFDILAFRNDPAPFFTNFVNTKVQEIINDGGGSVPVPGTLALMGLALAGIGARRRSL